MKIRVLLAGLGLIASASASAGVMFQWVPVSTDQPPLSINLNLVVSDSSAASGHVEFHSVSCNRPSTPALSHDCQPNPDASIQQFHFAARGNTDPINFTPTDGLFLTDLGKTFNVTADIVGGYLQGSISAFDTYATVLLSSVGNLFTVTDYRTDGYYPDGCDYRIPSCHGATGYIQEVSSLGTVPEPSTVLILLGGIIGFVATWKKERSMRSAGASSI